MKRLLWLAFSVLSFCQGFASINKCNSDTTRPKLNLHFGLSITPLFNWALKIDTAGNFLNSPVLFEPQVSFGSHLIAVGLNYSKLTNTFFINKQEYQSTKTRYCLFPSYLYKVLSIKQWMFFAGLTFTYDYTNNDVWQITTLETISKSNSVTTTGIAPDIRINYRINKHFSLEMESCFYFFTITTRYREIYPLTPNLGLNTSNSSSQQKFSIPANLILKVSL